MDTLSPLILLHGNGYKALAATNGGDDSRLVTGESQGKDMHVGEDDLDVTVACDSAAEDSTRKGISEKEEAGGRTKAF